MKPPHETVDHNTDFTKTGRAPARSSRRRVPLRDPSRSTGPCSPMTSGHLRRKVIELGQGTKVLVDLAEPVALDHGDLLVLDDGRHAEIVAAAEELYDIRASDRLHQAELCWHIGNRHLAGRRSRKTAILRSCAAKPQRLATTSIKAMLEGLGAKVADVVGALLRRCSAPIRAQSHGHHHGHEHQDHGDKDAHGRLPGDPHYGHSHG